MTTEAVEAQPVTVDPGQIIRVNARFPGSPENVRFSYLPPQSNEAVHDQANDLNTLIQREGDLYHYSIDTRQMRGGLGWWYFVSEDPNLQKRRAKVGKFIVREVPTALYSDELTVVGATVEPHAEPKIWPWAAGGVAAGALFGVLAGRSLGHSPVAEEAAEVIDAPAIVSRPRTADGRFLSAAAPVVVEGEGDEVIDGEEVSSGFSGGTAALIALGAVALGALGVWLWRKYKTKTVESHVGEVLELPAHEESGLDYFGL